jgi:phage-related protein (TIGR01555 family)
MQNAGLMERALRRADSIVNWMTGLGSLLDRGRTAGPDTAREPLTWDELTALYRYNGYARRYVSIMAAEMTRAGWRVRDEEDQSADPTAEIDEALGLLSVIEEGLTWARLYGGCVLVPVFEEDVPATYRNNTSSWLAQPLELERLGKLTNIAVMTPYEAQVEKYEGRMGKRSFRKAQMWRLQPQVTSWSHDLWSGAVVHSSRVLYLSGARIPPHLRQLNAGYDDSVLQSCWDQVRHKTSADQGMAAMLQQIKMNVIKVEGMASMQLGDQEEYFQLRMKEIAQGMSLHDLLLLDQGEEFHQINAQVSGLGLLDDKLARALCAVTGMPATLFFGDAPSGLNTDGESGRRIWDKVIGAAQRHFLQAELRRLYTMIFASQDGPEAPEGKWGLEFNPLDQPTEREQAEIEDLHARTDETRIRSQVVTSEHVRRSRFGEGGYRHQLDPIPEQLDPPAALPNAPETPPSIPSTGSEDV